MNNIQITTTQPTVLDPMRTIENSPIPVEVREAGTQGLFMPGGSCRFDRPTHQLLHLLFTQKKVDIYGFRDRSQNWPSIDPLNAPILKETSEFLKKNIEITSHYGTSVIQLCHLLQHLRNLCFKISPGKVDASIMKLIGSHMQQMEHKHGWLINNLAKIVDKEAIPQAEKTSMDSDLRIYPYAAHEDLVKFLSAEVVAYITNSIYWNVANTRLRTAEDHLLLQLNQKIDYRLPSQVLPNAIRENEPPTAWLFLYEQIKQTCLDKFNFFKSKPAQNEKQTLYSIVSFSKIDLMFVKALVRDHLFTLDDIKIRIETILLCLEKGFSAETLKILPESDHDLWQHIIDQLCYMLHCIDIKTADESSYIRAIWHLLSGAINLDPQFEMELLQKISAKSLDEKLFAQEMANSILEYMTKHKANQKDALIPLTLRTLISLKECGVSPFVIQSIWENLREPMNQSKGDSFYDKIFDLLEDPNLSFEMVYDLLQVYSFFGLSAEKQATTAFFIGRNGNHPTFEIVEKYTLSSRLEIDRALTKLRPQLEGVYPQLKVNTQESLRQLLLDQTFCSMSQETALKFHGDHLAINYEAAAKEALLLINQSTVPFLQQLGYLNLLACQINAPEIDLKAEIVTHFQNQLKLCANEDERNKLLANVRSIFKGQSLAALFETSTSENSANEWLQGLINSCDRDNLKLFKGLWLNHEMDGDAKKALTPEFLRKVLSLDLSEGLDLFERLQKAELIEESNIPALFELMCQMVQSIKPVQVDQIDLLKKGLQKLLVLNESSKKQRKRSKRKQQGAQDLISKNSLKWLLPEIFKLRAGKEEFFILADTLSQSILSHTEEASLCNGLCRTALLSEKGLPQALQVWDLGVKKEVWDKPVNQEMSHTLFIDLLEKLDETHDPRLNDFLRMGAAKELNAELKKRFVTVLTKKENASEIPLDKYIDYLSAEQLSTYYLKKIDQALKNSQIDEAIENLKAAADHSLDNTELTFLKERFFLIYNRLLQGTSPKKAWILLKTDCFKKMFLPYSSEALNVYLDFLEKYPEDQMTLETILDELTDTLSAEQFNSFICSLNSLMGNLAKGLSSTFVEKVKTKLSLLFALGNKYKLYEEQLKLLTHIPYRKIKIDIDEFLVKKILELSHYFLKKNTHLDQIHKLLFAWKLHQNSSTAEIQPKAQLKIYSQLIDMLFEDQSKEIEYWIGVVLKHPLLETANLQGWAEKTFKLGKYRLTFNILEKIPKDIHNPLWNRLVEQLAQTDVELCAKVLIDHSDVFLPQPDSKEKVTQIVMALQAHDNLKSALSLFPLLDIYSVPRLDLWEKALEAVKAFNIPIFRENAALFFVHLKTTFAQQLNEDPKSTFSAVMTCLDVIQGDPFLNIVDNLKEWQLMLFYQYESAEYLALAQLLMRKLCPYFSNPNKAEWAYALVSLLKAELEKLSHENPAQTFPTDFFVIKSLICSKDTKMFHFGLMYFMEFYTDFIATESTLDKLKAPFEEILLLMVVEGNELETTHKSTIIRKVNNIITALADSRKHIHEFDIENLCNACLKSKTPLLYVTAANLITGYLNAVSVINFENLEAFKEETKKVLVTDDFDNARRLTEHLKKKPTRMIEEYILYFLKNVIHALMRIVTGEEPTDEDTKGFAETWLKGFLLSDHLNFTFRRDNLAEIASVLICERNKKLKVNFDLGEAQENLSLFNDLYSLVKDFPDMEIRSVNANLDTLLLLTKHTQDPLIFHNYILSFLQGAGEAVCVNDFEKRVQNSKLSPPMLFSYFSGSTDRNKVDHLKLNPVRIANLSYLYLANKYDPAKLESETHTYVQVGERPENYVSAEAIVACNFENIWHNPQQPQKLYSLIFLILKKLMEFDFNTPNPKANSILYNFQLTCADDLLTYLLRNYHGGLMHVIPFVENFIFWKNMCNVHFHTYHLSRCVAYLHSLKTVLEPQTFFKIGIYITLAPLSLMENNKIKLTFDQCHKSIKEIIDFFVSVQDNHALYRALKLLRNIERFTVNALWKNITEKDYLSMTSHYKTIMNAVLERLYETLEVRKKNGIIFYGDYFQHILQKSLLLNPSAFSSPLWKKNCIEIQELWCHSLLNHHDSHMLKSKEEKGALILLHDFLLVMVNKETFGDNYIKYVSLLNSFCDRLVKLFDNYEENQESIKLMSPVIRLVDLFKLKKMKQKLKKHPLAETFKNTIEKLLLTKNTIALQWAIELIIVYGETLLTPQELKSFKSK